MSDRIQIIVKSYDQTLQTFSLPKSEQEAIIKWLADKETKSKGEEK